MSRSKSINKGFVPVRFYRLGRLFKDRRLIRRERTELWAIALALVLYHLGLSLRKTALLLGAFGVERSHVAIWYWLQRMGERWPVWEGPLPSCIVIDETWVKVGGRSAWIFTAIDPFSWRIIYLEPFFTRSEETTSEFLKHLAEAYGSWPKEVITDGGSWYRAAVPLWSWKEKFLWRVVRGGLRSSIEGFFGEFLKRRLKDFDCYVPTKQGLGSLRHWLWGYAWFHNWLLMGGLELS